MQVPRVPWCSSWPRLQAAGTPAGPPHRGHVQMAQAAAPQAPPASHGALHKARPLHRFPPKRGSLMGRAEAAGDEKREPTSLPLLTLPSSPCILSASTPVSAVFGLWWSSVKAAAAICSVMKQGAAMAPKGLVYSTNLPSTHFLLRILTPNLIVKSRIDWKMQMAI